MSSVKGTGDTGVKINQHSNDTDAELMQEMEAMDDIARERDEDVNRLIDTINELAHLFKQMNQQVIEQGTLVDRIDYNIERTLGHVQKAKVELRKAHQYQDSKCANYCIRVLIILISFFSLMLVLKYAHRG